MRRGPTPLRASRPFRRTRSLMRFVRQSRIPAPPQVVFAFHESPGALTALIPPWENMRVVESANSLRPGSRVVLAGRVGPFPIRWVAEHTTYEPPHEFVDVQRSGPFALWEHRHRFLDDGEGGTILRDEVEYRLPFGVVGQFLAGQLVRRQLERMFDFRHSTTRQLVTTP